MGTSTRPMCQWRQQTDGMNSVVCSEGEAGGLSSD